MAKCKKCGREIPNGETKCDSCKETGKWGWKKVGEVCLVVVVAAVGIFMGARKGRA